MMKDFIGISEFDEQIQNAEHIHMLAENLHNLQKSNVLCDVTLTCGGKPLNAHKVVLAACSEYFQAMFTSGMCETTNTEIKLKNVDTEALSTLVRYSYTGILIVNEVNVQIVLETADLLQFHSAKIQCCDYIKDKLNVENCLDVFQFASIFNCDDVLLMAQNLFNKSWKKVICTDNFQLLEFDVLMRLVSSDFLQILKETEVVHMIIRWAEGDINQRIGLLPNLFDNVRWSYIEPLELENLIKCEPLLLKNRALLDIIRNYIQHRCVSLSPYNMRKSYESWMYVLGGEQSFLMELKSCEFFSHKSCAWEYGFSLHGPRTSFAAVVNGDKLYVLGGMRFGEKLKIVECYNQKLGKWKRLSSLKKCLGDVKAVVVEDVVYVAGGSGEGEPACRYCERYDESNNQWHTVASMRTRRRRFGLCAYASKLYALGGFQDTIGDLSSCETYDTEANSWIQIASMKTNRCDVGVAVLSGFIYVAGGVNSYTGSICSVERYNPATNTWTMCQPLQQARGGHAMLSYFGRIVAIGGMNSYMQTCKEAEWYNEVDDKWTSLPCTNMPRFCGVAVALPFCRRPRICVEQIDNPADSS